jgi:hypothetical protein
MRNLLKTILIGICFALLWHCLASCDGSGGGGADAGNPCEGLNVIVVVPINGVQPAQMMLNLCVGWSAAKKYGGVDACVAELTKTLGAAKATAECNTAMTEAECRDEAHDFVDSAGVPHWYGISSTAGYTMAITSFDIGTNAARTYPTTAICTTVGSSGVCLEGCH